MRCTIIYAIVISCVGCLLFGCNVGALRSDSEIVMCEGMQINAGDESKIRITAVGKSARNYKTEDVDVTVNLRLF